MYRQRAFNYWWTTLFFALVFDNFYQLTSSASSICTVVAEKKYIAVRQSAVEGQNISIHTFHLERPLLENQSIEWGKRMDGWKLECTHNLLCSGLNHERYKLIKGTHNKTMTILIEQAQKSDKGSHIISIFNRSRRECVILTLNLTVTDPPSSMSCRFEQNTKRERGNILLTEKWKNEPNQTSNMTLDNAVCNSANNFTVYLDFREILLVTQNSPSDCGVSRRNETENKTKSCKFDSLVEPVFLNDQARIVFERCNGNWETHQKWGYVHNGGHSLLPLPKKYKFLCESYPSSNVHNIARLNLREHKNTCTSVFEEDVDSTTFSNCTTLILNVSTASPPTTTLISTFSTKTSGFANPTTLILNVSTASPSTTTLISTFSTKTSGFANPTLSTGRFNSSTSVKGSENDNKDTIILICVASISTIALVFSIASCFFKCKFVSGGGDLANHSPNSQAARHGGDTEPLQTIAFILSQNTSHLGSKDSWIQSDKPSQASVIDKGKHDHGQERGSSSSECQSEALELRTRPAMVEHHNLHDTLKDLGKPSTSTDESHIGTSYPSCVDSSYHSLDDVKDISRNRVHLPSAPQPLPCSPSSSNERGTRREENDSLDDKEMPSCQVKPKIRGEGTSASALVRSDVDALYAKPDMNRKTKKSISRSVPLESGRLEMTILDLDYDDVRNPMDSAIESATVNTSRKSEHIYESCD